MNGVKTVLLLGLLSGLFLAAGSYVAGERGLLIGLAFALVTNVVSYFFSDRIALAMYAAQPVSPSANARIYARVGPIVENLCRRMSLPMPRLWVIPENSPNAFATGRNPAHASVAVTSGILGILSDQELEGVLAHEMGHVLHRDILISSVAATLAAALMTVSRMAMWFGGGSRDDRNSSAAGSLVMLLVAPIAALFIQAAISRTREYSADAASAQYTGAPFPLVNALQKLDDASRRIPLDANPATAHMFIIQPFLGGGLGRLFSSHPPTAKRIARLLGRA